MEVVMVGSDSENSCDWNRFHETAREVGYIDDDTVFRVWRMTVETSRGVTPDDGFLMDGATVTITELAAVHATLLRDQATSDLEWAIVFNVARVLQ